MRADVTKLSFALWVPAFLQQFWRGKAFDCGLFATIESIPGTRLGALLILSTSGANLPPRTNQKRTLMCPNTLISRILPAAFAAGLLMSVGSHAQAQEIQVADSTKAAGPVVG